MPRLLLVLLLSLAMACGSSRAVTVDDTISPGDCATGEVQRLITYCASPQAADLALTNAELMAAANMSEGDLPYAPVPIGDSPVRGNVEAPVTIVMFTDLECPYCRQMHENLDALIEGSEGDVRIVFKHTPLSFHPNAVPAALGALAAREQGKFWDYVDRVYANQETLDREALMEHARAVGLDLEQFKNDFGSDSHIAAIESDLGLAAQIGVSGTPTMFVNGVRVVGLYPTGDLRALVEQQKALVARMQEAGVPQKDIYWRLVASQYQQTPRRQAEAPDEAPEPELGPVYVPIGDAPVKGAKAQEALVTIVEFSDFQCPFCAQANTAIAEVMNQHSATTRLAFRHFPLPNHPDAEAAAIASMAAQKAGKFWAYHDLLFAGQDDLTVDTLKARAKEAGFDPKQVTAALADERNEARVVADQKLGLESGVSGTPTFFVNGIPVQGVRSAEEFSALVEEQARIAKEVSEETGFVGEELYRAVVKRNQDAE